MKLLFWISLLLINLPATESTQEVESCLSQPNEVIWQKPGQSVVLPCIVNSHCYNISWDYEWFCFKENSHMRLKLIDKFRLEGGSLHISSLHANDSGVYYCAAETHGPPAPNSQYVGLGTTLIVKEHATQMTVILLSIALLSIYNLALVILLIKRYGCRRSHKTDKSDSNKLEHFRDVLQEMHRRGHRERTTQTATNTDVASTFDDIYQNV